ncbi:MAG: hypothetical protein RLY31_509 [Bacteroidota bacterium]
MGRSRWSEHNRMKNSIGWGILVFLVSVRLSTAIAAADPVRGHYTWNPRLKAVYGQIMEFRLAEASSELAEATRQDPRNLLILHLENYVDFLRCYLDEDEGRFRQLESNKDSRIRRIREEGDATSPYHLYLQADILLQWALARLKYNDYTTAVLDANRAFRILSTNQERFPDFLPNRKDLGILKGIVGTIPATYQQLLARFSRLQGTMEEAREDLRAALAAGPEGTYVYYPETVVFLTFFQLLLENDAAAAWRTVGKLTPSPERSPLTTYVKAQVALRTYRGDEAVRTLQNRPRGSRYHPLPYLEYMMGNAKLQRLDSDADRHFRQFVLQFGGRQHLKDAHRKLAWHAWVVRQDSAAYFRHMAACRTAGRPDNGTDQEAHRQAGRSDLPAPALLKARLLFDGGHFDRALAVLSDPSVRLHLMKPEERLEYTYRLGRIHHQDGRMEQAVQQYVRTLDEGADAPYYFACRAALELGNIHAVLGHYAAARRFYQQCLRMEPQEHAMGLHQQAKAGLKRLP